MAPKTLDLNAHAKTFADTYAHARRTGADRPLAHRFGLADVLGEIEEIIAKRVETAVAAAKSEAASATAKLKREHAEELAKLSVGRIVGRTVTADRITTGRYLAIGGDVHDTFVGDRAPFGSAVFARRVADELNRGTRRKASLFWTTTSRQTRRYL